ncbi:MAG: hypothetical protein KME26_16510 [Oscillatoria princeps RMCB-10]|nr:hypothetical protein [Oscillatoria princeps RMCB-10]
MPVLQEMGLQKWDAPGKTLPAIPLRLLNRIRYRATIGAPVTVPVATGTGANPQWRMAPGRGTILKYQLSIRDAKEECQDLASAQLPSASTSAPSCSP